MEVELIEVIKQRRTVRDFSKEDVAFEIIEKSLEAGLKAPSYNHLKQWDFMLVKEQNIRLALTQTEEMIEKADKRRSEYYNYYSYKTWGAAATYHLCVDSSSLGVEETVRFIEEFVVKKLQLI